uniref:Hexosyltransferase n=1 Tax=Macrostomum lignano TaxID=282301 RepID=A0A1I8G4X1_9PLAT
FINSRPHLWRVLFTTGSGRGANLQREIEEEAREFGDILQFRFLDTPHSGQRKTMGALMELNEDAQFQRCKPKFLLKVTDDTFVNMPAFVHWLASKFPAGKQTGLYVGHTVHGDVPDRNPQRTGYVSESIYPYPAFPDYNKNPAYLISWDLIPRLAGEIPKLEPIGVDDVYVGVLMARIGVRPQFNDHFVMLEGPMDVCMHLRMFFISHLRPSGLEARLFRSAPNREGRSTTEWIVKVVQEQHQAKAVKPGGAQLLINFHRETAQVPRMRKFLHVLIRTAPRLQPP